MIRKSSSPVCFSNNGKVRFKDVVSTKKSQCVKRDCCVYMNSWNCIARCGYMRISTMDDGLRGVRFTLSRRWKPDSRCLRNCWVTEHQSLWNSRLINWSSHSSTIYVCHQFWGHSFLPLLMLSSHQVPTPISIIQVVFLFLHRDPTVLNQGHLSGHRCKTIYPLNISNKCHACLLRGKNYRSSILHPPSLSPCSPLGQVINPKISDTRASSTHHFTCK